MPVVNPRSNALATASYTVAVEIENIHIGKRKVHKGDVLELTAPVAAHWLNEGVLIPTPAPAQGA